MSGEKVLHIDAPSAKQLAFFRARTKHVGFGGARGGGKSWAVRVKATLLALHYPGIRILIVRRTYPELINNHINLLKSKLRDVATYNAQQKSLRFACGSVIEFSYCAKDGDLDRLQGVEYDIIFLDEATQLSEYQMRAITACLRGTGDYPRRIYYTCNPGGQGHAYIKRIFIDRRYVDGEDPGDYTFIQSLATDNVALMRAQPDYIAQLEALPYKLRQAWLYGKWDIFEGQFFEDFVDAPDHYEDRRWTHVIAPFDVPADWTIYRSFDWGYARPFSCGWWAVDYDGRLYRIAELYGCGGEPNTGVKWPPDKVFSEIARVEKEHPWLSGKAIRGVADPAIWDAETGESIADVAGRYGIFFQRGDHKRIPGWMQMHYRLAFDERGLPMMQVFSTCKGFIRTLPLLQYDDVKVEDLDTSGEDHIADETRYMCMARPIKPRVKPQDDGYYQNPMYTALDIPREDLLPAPTETMRVEVIDGTDYETPR